MADSYYNDGGVWRKLKELHYNDGGVWRKVKELWYNDAGTWRKVFTGGFSSFSMSSHTVSGQADLELSEPGVAQYVVYPTGKFAGEYSQNSGSLDTEVVFSNEWAVPLDPTGVSGAAYQVMFTQTFTNSIGFLSATLNTWMSLSVLRSFSLEGPIYKNTAARTINIKIRRASDSVVVIDQDVFIRAAGAGMA